jgi:hypothetical protein
MRQAGVFSSIRRRFVRLGLSGLATTVLSGVASAAPVLKVDTVDVPWGETGQYHYVDELRLSVGSSAPAVLRTSLEGDDLAPIPGPQYPLGDNHVLLLGWSSTGGGAETLHAMVFEIAPAGVQLRRHLTMTRDRWSSLLVVRRVAPAEVLLGFLEPPGGPARSEEDDYSLVLGPDRGDRLSWPRVRKLAYAVSEPLDNDYYYAPPFGSVISGVLVADGTLGSHVLHVLEVLKTAAPLPRPRFAWLTLTPDGAAVAAPPH